MPRTTAELSRRRSGRDASCIPPGGARALRIPSAFFEAEGVAKIEETGRFSPSEQARRRTRRLMATTRAASAHCLAEPPRDLATDRVGIRATTPQRTLHTGSVILTTGGQSYPGCGTTGDGGAPTARLGHTLRPRRVRLLVPITVIGPLGRPSYAASPYRRWRFASSKRTSPLAGGVDRCSLPTLACRGR